MDLISIIVPIFNAEKYLSECLDSLVKQSYHEIEIILVDDGSSDSSNSICTTFANNDSRITVLKKDNGGVSSARNLGLKHANGKYIYFVDADDIISPDAIKILYDLISSREYDISMCCMTKFKDDDVRFRYSNTCKELNCDQILGYVLGNKQPYGYLWNKMFRSDAIKMNGVCFDESIHIFEDELFILQYLATQSRGVFNNSKIYGYRDVSDGAVNSPISMKKTSAVEGRRLVFERLLELTNNVSLIKEEYKKLITYLTAYYYLVSNSKLPQKKQVKKRIREIDKEFRGKYHYDRLPLKWMLGYYYLRSGL